MRGGQGFEQRSGREPACHWSCKLNAADKNVDLAISGLYRSRATQPPRRRGIQSDPFYMNPARDPTARHQGG